ncbi:hypothetical protein COOONC_03130 [Cooperia oncophora]
MYNSPKPAFLSKVDDAARKQFFAIVRNPNLTSDQKKTQVIEFAKKHGFEEEGKKHVKKIEDLKKQGKLCLPPPPPEFLKKVNETARKEIFNIIKNQTVPIKQRRAKVTEWAKKYGVEKQVKSYDEKMKKLFSKQ